MADISQGNRANLILSPGDVYRISTAGTATVSAAYGAPAGVTTVTAATREFGPYDAPAKLVVNAVTGSTSYALKQPIGSQPVGGSGGGGVFIAQPTEASIREQVALAQAAGGGTVRIPPGKNASGNWATIPLAAPLPWVSGVSYEGSRPVTVPLDGAPDLGINIVGGTVFSGNGTFPGVWDGAVDQPTPYDPPVRSINGANVRDLGFVNFTNALRAGADPVIYGLFNCTIDGVWAKDCTSDAFYFNNFQHCEFKNLYDADCAHGPLWTGNGGNAVIDNIFSEGPQGDLYSKGIRFDSPHPTGWLNFIDVGYLQRNSFGRVAISVSAGFTNGSSSVTVPDGTKFAVGMPWKLPAGSNFGTLNADRVVYVRSVVFNAGTTGPATITLATDLSRSAIHTFTAATGSYTITSGGFPLLSITRGPNGTATAPGGNVWTGANQSGLILRAIDLEGLATCQMDIQYSNATIVANNAVSQITTYPTLNVIASTVSYGGTEISMYLDNLSAFYPKDYVRIRKFYPGSYSPFGFYVDTSGSSLDVVMSLTRNVPAGSNQMSTVFAGANLVLYPGRGIGQKTSNYNNTSLAGFGNLGDNTFRGNANATWVLGAPPANATDYLGVPIGFYNDSGSFTLTIQTAGGAQPFSRVTGRTQYTLAPGQFLNLKYNYDGTNGYYTVLATNGTPNV